MDYLSDISPHRIQEVHLQGQALGATTASFKTAVSQPPLNIYAVTPTIAATSSWKNITQCQLATLPPNMLWLRSRNSCSRSRCAPLLQFLSLVSCHANWVVQSEQLQNSFNAEFTGAKKPQYFFLIEFVQQICGYFLKKVQTIVANKKKPAEKIFDKYPQSCVNGTSPLAFPHIKIQNISYWQGQGSDNGLASYQDKTWTHTTLQSQPLASIMGKCHHKGKKNFIEHLTKFPDTYGQDTRLQGIPVKLKCFEKAYPSSALPCEMQILWTKFCFQRQLPGYLHFSQKNHSRLQTYIRSGPMKQISDLPERSLRLPTVCPSGTVFGMLSLHKTSLDSQVMCFWKQSTTCACKAY